MRRTVCAALFLILLSLAGCASVPQEQRDPRDPWQRMNRATYKFNDVVDRHFTKPIAQGYKKVTPQPVRTGISNFLDNIDYPVTIVNDLLQLKFKPFCQDTGRFVLNSTLGIGGLFDPATQVGLYKNNEDFGQTLGYWGAPAGPYLVLPILGPSDVRDTVGNVADGYAEPRNYFNWQARYGLTLLWALDTRTRLLDTEKALEGVYDPYAFLRNAYLQRRQYLINDGKGGASQQDEEERLKEEQRILEESGESPEERATPAQPAPGQPAPGQPAPGQPGTSQPAPQPAPRK